MRSHLGILLVAIALCSSGTALAFRDCTNATGSVIAGHWPDPRNTGGFGSQKWEFDWKVDQEGLEISNVRYTSDLSQPKKMVMRRGSLPFLPVHYPEAAPVCGGSPHGYNDRLSVSNLDTANPFCCYHVPTTVCNLPDRPQACVPPSGRVDTSTCPGGAVSCSGVCVGTQFDGTPPIEDGVGEVVTGASNGDVLLSTTFKLGGYQFIQRWRFMDNGTILPSLRAGGVHNCQWHNHQIYWRFNFEMVESGTGQSEIVQQCDAGGCSDTGADWSASLGCACGTRPQPNSWWRLSDNAVPGRMVIVQTGANEGSASHFCEGTTTECGSGGCVNGRDFCALAAQESHETFIADNCNDHLQDAVSAPACTGIHSGGDLAFWYVAHLDHHDPCSFLPICDPELGAVAFGPTIRLVGSW